jgi:geranylgeranyl transferase type-2 subunit alpha
LQHGVPRVSGIREKDSEKEKRNITSYTTLVKQVQDRVHTKDFSPETLDLTSKLLTRNPEYYTIWNYRRRVLQHLINAEGPLAVDLISSDLQFLVPLLLQFPKCYWIWNYRIWLLDQIEGTLKLEDGLRLWKEEMGLVGKMLTRDERNFHGWDYRRHVVSQIERIQGSEAKSLVEPEFEYTTKMIRRALQNFSALHYRRKLIPRLLNERNASPQERRQLLNHELDMMQDALIDPFNQSAWFYHQYLMSTIAVGCPRDSSIVLDLSEGEREQYFKQEVTRIQEILEDYDDCKWVYQALLQCHVDAGRMNHVSDKDINFWLDELKRLDPLRLNRWNDLKAQLSI